MLSWIALAMVYILVGGFTGFMARNAAMKQCEYYENGHMRSFVRRYDKYYCRRNHDDENNVKWYSQPNCYHKGTEPCDHGVYWWIAGGVMWPVYAPILIGRELAQVVPNWSTLRHEAKLEKVRRARQLSEEQLRVAQIDAERKRIEARGTDEELRSLGLLGRMGENPYDRDRGFGS